DFLVAAIVEIVDTAVFEEPADNRADADILRNAWHSRAEAADAAHDELHVDADVRRFVEGADDFGLNECVELGDDVARAAGVCVARLALDQRKQSLVEVERRL